MTGRFSAAVIRSGLLGLLLCGVVLSGFGAYVCLVRLHIYYMELYRNPMHPMIAVWRESIIWVTAAVFILLGLYVVLFAFQKLARRQLPFSILRKSFVVGVIRCFVALDYSS
jgi:hypothetical protein